MVCLTAAIITAVGSPELAELRAAVKPVPVKADDLGGWVTGQRGLGEPVDYVQLLRRIATEDVDAAATSVNRVRELVCEYVGVSA